MPRRKSTYLLLKFDFDFDAGRKFEGCKRLDGFLRRFDDINQSLVGSVLKLFAAVLIFMNSTAASTNV